MFEGVDRLIDDKNADQRAVLEKLSEQQKQDMLQKMPEQQKCRSWMDGYTSNGRGWWPAIIVSWDGEHLTTSNFDGRLYREMQNRGKVRIWVICWYQLCDGTYTVEAWPIHLLTPLCRL